MKSVNEVKTVCKSLAANESFARTVAAAFASQTDPVMSELAEFKTAVSEAVTNAAVHGYRDSVGNIVLKLKLYEGNVISATVSDRGVGIEDVKKAREPLFTTSESGEQAGMGFTVMESFCDGVKVRSKPGRGTTVVLTKKFRSKNGV